MPPLLKPFLNQRRKELRRCEVQLPATLFLPMQTGTEVAANTGLCLLPQGTGGSQGLEVSLGRWSGDEAGGGKGQSSQEGGHVQKCAPGSR